MCDCQQRNAVINSLIEEAERKISNLQAQAEGVNRRIAAETEMLRRLELMLTPEEPTDA